MIEQAIAWMAICLDHLPVGYPDQFFASVASVVITGDSLPMHVASALIARWCVFGPTMKIPDRETGRPGYSRRWGLPLLSKAKMPSRVYRRHYRR